jgi:hypothetical protein
MASESPRPAVTASTWPVAVTTTPADREDGNDSEFDDTNATGPDSLRWGRRTALGSVEG